MRNIIAAIALCLGGTVSAHDGEVHGPPVLKLPERPEIRTAEDAKEEAARECLKAGKQIAGLTVRLTYSNGEVSVACPAKAAISVSKTVRF
jgi:hypothetical protein